MRLRLLVFLGLFSVAQSWAQKPLFREDQIYIGAGVLIANANQQPFSQTDFSGQFQFGLIRDFPISKDSRWALGIGLGHDYRSLVSNLYLETNPLTNAPQQFRWLTSDEEPSGFRQSRLVLPLELRWRSATVTSDIFWRIHGGVKLSYIYRNTFQNLASSLLNNVVEPWQLSAQLVAGYNTWNFYFEYELLPWLNPDFPNVEGGQFRLQTFQLGVIFYFL